MILSRYEMSLLKCTEAGLLFKTWVRPRAQTVRNLMLKSLIEKVGDNWILTKDGQAALKEIRS